MEFGPPTLTRESACGPRRSAKRAAESERGWGPASIEQRHCREYFQKASRTGWLFFCTVRWSSVRRRSRERAPAARGGARSAQPRASGGGAPRALSNVTAGSILKKPAEQAGFSFVRSDGGRSADAHERERLRPEAEREARSRERAGVGPREH